MVRVRVARLVVSVAVVAVPACGSDPDRVGVPGLAADPTVGAAPSTIATGADPDPVPATTERPTTTTVPVAVSTAGAPTTTGSTTLPPLEPPPIVYYRAGDEAVEIAAIQEDLVVLGYLDAGSYTPERFDGATNDAVVSFQSQYGVLVDGVVGPETRRALRAAAASVIAAN